MNVSLKKIVQKLSFFQFSSKFHFDYQFGTFCAVLNGINAIDGNKIQWKNNRFPLNSTGMFIWFNRNFKFKFKINGSVVDTENNWPIQKEIPWLTNQTREWPFDFLSY